MIRADTDKNTTDIQDLNRRVSELEGKLLVDAKTLQDIKDKVALLDKDVQEDTFDKIPDAC